MMTLLAVLGWLLLCAAAALGLGYLAWLLDE